MTVAVLPAQAYAEEASPAIICAVERHSNEIVEEYSKLLSPPSGATVLAGAAVTFSAQSGSESPLTFTVASSLALLSSPDIDSGPGLLLAAGEYSFTSTKAAATPRTVYWTASFTRVLRDCEGPPVTFTIPPRTLTVLPSPTEEEAAAKKQEEEAAARKKADEEAAAIASVSLDGVAIRVQSNYEAAVKLACVGTATCSGKLTLTALGVNGKGKKKHAKTEAIGSAIFSIAAGRTATVKLTLNKTGRALLRVAHGYLSATLTIVKTSPGPSKTRTQGVHLEQQKMANARRSKVS
ncbi:MAG: hypothetical protein ACLQBY_16390 [Solirubrobacteraceae bacterium]